jgi:hypothetical protein
MMFYQICHKPAHYIVTFFRIHHRWINPLWRSIKFIMDEESIVQSAWTHLLFLAYVAWIYHVGPTCQIGTKNLFLDYQNIILCHLVGPHASSTWTEFFLMKLQMLVHMSDWHRKKLFFGLAKYNIMSPWWPTCQLSLDWIF